MTVTPRYSPAIERAVQADNRARLLSVVAVVQAAMPKPSQSEKKI